MSKKLLGWMLVGVVGGALVGCGGGAAEGAGASEAAAQYEGPVQSTDTARGEQLFTDVCGACHMEGGSGPDLSTDPHPVAQIRMTVREGSGTMPPLGAGQVSDHDLEAILAYMTSIQAAH